MSQIKKQSKCNLLHTIIDHTSSVDSVKFHPYIPVIATACFDNTSLIYQVDSNGNNTTLIGNLNRHTGSVTCVAFHPQLLFIATGSYDKTVNLWHMSNDGRNQTLVTSFKDHNRVINSVNFHPTLPILVTGSDDKSIKLFKCSPIMSECFLIYSLDGHPDYTDLTGGHTSRVSCVIFHPFLPIFVSSGDDKLIKLWHLSEDNSSAFFIDNILGNPQGVSSLAFHPTQNLLASSSTIVKIWKLDSNGNPLYHKGDLVGHEYSITCVVFHSLLSILITSSLDYTIKIWNSNTLQCLETIDAHISYVTSIDIHPNLPIFASSSSDSTVKFWHCKWLSMNWHRERSLMTGDLTFKLVKRLLMSSNVRNDLSHMSLILNPSRKLYPMNADKHLLPKAEFITESMRLFESIEFIKLNDLSGECEKIHDKLQSLKKLQILLNKENKIKELQLTNLWIKKLEKRILQCSK